MTPWTLMSMTLRVVALGLFGELSDVHDSGVVDQRVDGTELSVGLVDERGERVAVGHVERQRDYAAAKLLGGRLRELEVEVADRDARALADERCCGRATDPAGPAGDRDDPAVERDGWHLLSFHAVGAAHIPLATTRRTRPV
jgi:hypothetical protein